MTTTFNPDRFLADFHQRRTEPRDDEYAGGFCGNCDAQLTIADVDGGECSQCHSAIESDDEDLLAVEEGDYLWDGYSHSD